MKSICLITIILITFQVDIGIASDKQTACSIVSVIEFKQLDINQNLRIKKLYDTARLQYLTVNEFLNKLGRYESLGNYKAINPSTKFKGKYQFSPYMIKTFAKVDQRTFLNSPRIQEKSMRKTIAHYRSYIFNMGYNKYINKEIDGVTITMEGLLLGVHFCPQYLKWWLNSKGKINKDDGLTTIRDYMEKFEKKGVTTIQYTTVCREVRSVSVH